MALSRKSNRITTLFKNGIKQKRIPKSGFAFRDSPIIINQTCSRYDYDLVLHADLGGYAVNGDDIHLTGGNGAVY